MDAIAPDAIREYGFFWTVLVVSVAAFCYFAPSIKKLVETYPERKRKSELVIENNTAALHACEAALSSNAEAFRDERNERDRNTAILIEHDRKSEIRLQHQNEALGRIESKL